MSPPKQQSLELVRIRGETLLAEVVLYIYQTSTKKYLEIQRREKNLHRIYAREKFIQHPRYKDDKKRNHRLNNHPDKTYVPTRGNIYINQKVIKS